MKKTAEGIYEDRITDQITMVVNENTDEIIVQVEGKSPIKYPFPEGVKSSDVERIREHVISNFRMLVDNFHRLEINSQTSILYNPEINLIRIVHQGQHITLPGAEKIVTFLLGHYFDQLLSIKSIKLVPTSEMARKIKKALKKVETTHGKVQ